MVSGQQQLAYALVWTPCQGRCRPRAKVSGSLRWKLHTCDRQRTLLAVRLALLVLAGDPPSTRSLAYVVATWTSFRQFGGDAANVAGKPLGRSLPKTYPHGSSETFSKSSRPILYHLLPCSNSRISLGPRHSSRQVPKGGIFFPAPGMRRIGSSSAVRTVVCTISFPPSAAALSYRKNLIDHNFTG